MSNSLHRNISRRKFIAASTGLFAGSALLKAMPPYSFSSQELKDELSEEELKLVEQSSMAKELKDYFHKGYSCAESLLMVSLRYLNKPEELVWAAAGYGGGLGHKDLCGFLTAGVMGIGFAAGSLKKDREEAKDWCSKKVKEYWKWWKENAPLHCKDIRTPGSSSKRCARLGQLGAAKVEELICPVQA